MPFLATAAIRGFQKRFRELGSPRRAAGEKAYLKSPLQFHGVTVPQLRAEARAFCKQTPDLSRRDLRSLTQAAYRTEFHDLRSVAISVLERDVAVLEPADLGWVMELVRQSANWAHVDWISTKVLGALVARAPNRDRIVRRWARDRDFWVRRAAMLSLLDELRSGRGDFGLFAEIAAPMLEEKEFFIRKALGWVLREVSRKRPALVVAFVARHSREMSGLTFREATRHLPGPDRRRLARLRARVTPGRVARRSDAASRPSRSGRSPRPYSAP